MFSKKYKFLGRVIEVITPEEIIDTKPYADFLCEEEPHCTVTFEYADAFPEIPENAVTDSEITFIAQDNKSFCWYRNHGKEGYFAYRTGDGKAQRVLISDEYSGKLWNGTLFNIMGFEEIMAEGNSAVLHASMIKVQDKIILFTAPCGTGKSTQANLWEKYAGAVIVNGDKALVKSENGSITAGGLAFSGSSDICKNISAPLCAVVYLSQAKENKIRKMSKSEAFISLMQGNYHSAMGDWASQKVTDVIESICENVPVYKLECLPDKSAVECLKRELSL